ncbi:MAG: hypothetical protein OHK0046_35520 [Anaerolineae bacterium]
MNKTEPITTLTIAELQALIRETVQEAVAEVLVEFSIAAEHDAQLMYQAEIADMLRASLRGALQGQRLDLDNVNVADD